MNRNRPDDQVALNQPEGPLPGAICQPQAVACQRQRWLLVMAASTDNDHVERNYQLWVQPLDTDDATPQLIYTVDELLTALLRPWGDE